MKICNLHKTCVKKYVYDLLLMHIQRAKEAKLTTSVFRETPVHEHAPLLYTTYALIAATKQDNNSSYQRIRKKVTTKRTLKESRIKCVRERAIHLKFVLLLLGLTSNLLGIYRLQPFSSCKINQGRTCYFQIR